MILCGTIYKITNKENGKAYVGQTVSSLKKRIQLACTGKAHSEESKIKASKSKDNKKVRVLCINSGQIYDSIIAAFKILKIPRANIWKVMKGERKMAKGLSFKAVTNEC